MNLVKNRINYSLYPSKRTYRLSDEYDAMSGGYVQGPEYTEDGILTFATAHKQVSIKDWNIGQQTPEDVDLSNMRQSCIDYAPFLFQHSA